MKGIKDKPEIECHGWLEMKSGKSRAFLFSELHLSSFLNLRTFTGKSSLSFFDENVAKIGLNKYSTN